MVRPIQAYIGGPTVAKPFALSFAQEEPIARAAAALHVADRPTFYGRVHEQLDAAPEIGDGLVYRACGRCSGHYSSPRTPSSITTPARPSAAAPCIGR